MKNLNLLMQSVSLEKNTKINTLLSLSVRLLD